MARIILVSGRGGAGKTTVAAATGLAASRRGIRTMVLSLDLSPSLSGAFGREDPLFSGARGVPVGINEHLSIHELDIADEIRRGWSDGQGDLAALTGGGLESVTAQEVAQTADTAHLVTLLRLGEYVREQKHDLLIVDCPSTREALNLVSCVSAMSWYLRRQQAPEGKGRSARLMAASAFGAEARERLSAVDELLRNPEVTTLRLVTTADRVSVQETQRAYTYFSLHGITTDCVVINRLAPEGERAPSEQLQVEKLQSLFDPIPVVKAPRHADEVVGENPLEAFSGLLYKGEDPARPMVSQQVLGFIKEAVEVYRLEVKLPFVAKSEVELSRRGDEFVIQVGSSRRNVLLPRMIALLPTLGARMDGDRLVVSFRKKEVSNG